MTQRAEERRPMPIESSSLRNYVPTILKYAAPGIAADLDLSQRPARQKQNPKLGSVSPETLRALDELAERLGVPPYQRDVKDKGQSSDDLSQPPARDTKLGSVSPRTLHAIDELAERLGVPNYPDDLDARVRSSLFPDVAETDVEHTFFTTPRYALLFQLAKGGISYISGLFNVSEQDIEVVNAQQRIYRVNPRQDSDRTRELLYRNATFVLELPQETGKISAERVKDGTMVYIEKPGRFSPLRVTSKILAMIPIHTNGDTAAVTSAVSRALSPVAVHLRNGEKPVLLYRHLGDSESDANGDATGAPYQQALAPYQDQVAILPTAMFGAKGVPYHAALKTWTATPIERA